MIRPSLSYISIALTKISTQQFKKEKEQEKREKEKEKETIKNKQKQTISFILR